MKRVAKEKAWAPVLPVDAILATLTEDGRHEDVTGLVMEARNDLARKVHASLGRPKGEVASVMTDLATRHLVSSLTGLDVIAMIESRPELVVEARKLVEAVERKRPGR